MQLFFLFLFSLKLLSKKKTLLGLTAWFEVLWFWMVCILGFNVLLKRQLPGLLQPVYSFKYVLVFMFCRCVCLVLWKLFIILILLVVCLFWLLLAFSSKNPPKKKKETLGDSTSSLFSFTVL